MRLHLLFLATTAAAQVVPAPEIASIPRLPCVTTGFGNTLIRGNTFQDKTQTWMQLYTADMAVSAEGFVFLTTKWEEGLRAAGIYKDGDALPEMTGLGVNSGEAVAVSERFVAYAREVKDKNGLGMTLIVFDRPAGSGLDGAKKRTAYLREQKGSITGLAIDEARERAYFADDEGVRALSLKTLRPLDFRIVLERAGKMLVDETGALWVIQRAPSAFAHTRLEAQVFGSEPIDAEHGLERAVSSSDQIKYIAKDSTSAFVGLDFGKAVSVSRFSLMGDSAKSDFRQLKVQTSAIGRDGPWTDVATPVDKLYNYPEEFVTLDASQPIRAVRVIAPELTMCRMAAYAPPQMISGRVLKFDPQGAKLPQSIADITQPMDIAIDPRTKRLFVADGGPNHQIHGFSDQNGQMTREVSLGEKGGWRAQK
ncbi:MAG: YncE family protein, partial [Prosthecobacter sp.]